METDLSTYLQLSHSLSPKQPLSSWIEDFFARIKFMQDWLLQGPRKSYWISGFFFPQGFMTAVKQTYSRDYKIAIDTLVVGCEILNFDSSAVKSSPKDGKSNLLTVVRLSEKVSDSLFVCCGQNKSGVYIHGLFMEGARFDRKSMVIEESIPGVLFDTMPCIWLKPAKQNDEEPQQNGFYSCPLYKTSKRAGTLSTTGHSTNYVVALDIPTTKESDHWIRRGAAFLCMLDT